MAAFSIAWFLGTQDKDFTTPPSDEEITTVAMEWEKSRPNIPPPRPINAELLAAGGHADFKKLQFEALPLGDLDKAPSLTEYGTLGHKGTNAMGQLATLLERKGETQRALLAWERIIDTTRPKDKQRTIAAKAIKRLKNKIPPWNPDSDAGIIISLRAGATLKDKETLTTTINQAAENINIASGHILKVDARASIGQMRGEQPSRIPIAIWFTHQPEGSDKIVETPPISFMADPRQKEMLLAQIETGIYALVRTHLARATSFSKLPEYPSGAKPHELLNLHITRLMWREFASSLRE